MTLADQEAYDSRIRAIPAADAIARVIEILYPGQRIFIPKGETEARDYLIALAKEAGIPLVGTYRC